MACVFCARPQPRIMNQHGLRALLCSEGTAKTVHNRGNFLAEKSYPYKANSSGRISTSIAGASASDHSPRIDVIMEERQSKEQCRLVVNRISTLLSDRPQPDLISA